MTRRLQRSLQLLAVAAIATGANGAAAKQPAPTVAWLVFVDDLHLDFRNTGRIRDLVRTVLKQLPQEGEAVAMFSSGPSNVSVMPTADRALLNDEVKKLTGSGLKTEDLQADPSRREAAYRAGMARSRLLELIGKVANATADKTDAPSRLPIIYISNGYTAGTSAPLKTDLAPPIFAIDPRLLMDRLDPDRVNRPEHFAETRNSLRVLAEASGGFLAEEGEPVNETIIRIARAMR